VIGFVTYAQNFEDLMLWRALNGVTDGFYIDVGAADSDEDSVTRAFYDRGWHGINIEPSPDHFASLAAARPRDINLRCLVGSEPGETDLYSIPETGLSTVDRDLAAQHIAEGRPAEVVRVPVRTLAEICREFASTEIHFLKIDVEGAEADVLRGADFKTYRPWIVLVEATVPMSQTENWQSWDPLLNEADYTFVWFDGLNRFYLASERVGQLRQAFNTPPNVFDGWIRPRGHEQIALLKRAQAVQDAMEDVRVEASKARADLDAEVAAARSEAVASRLESSNARAEASALRANEAAARHEVMTARAEAASLRIALTAIRAEADGVKANAVALGAALTEARENLAAAQTSLTEARQHAGFAQAQVSGLASVQQALERAEATVAALQTSTSWKMTAPLRKLSLGLQRLGNRPGRWERLRMVAHLGQGSSNVSTAATRLTIYGFGRLISRVPGGRSTARLAGTVFPGPYSWLRARYQVYLNSARAAQDALAPRALPPLESDTMTDRNMDQNNLSVEEQMMLRRVGARNNTA